MRRVEDCREVTGDDTYLEKGQEHAIWGIWPVRVSTLFPVFPDVAAPEPSIMSILLPVGEVVLLLAVKLARVTLICLPLVVYVALNGSIPLSGFMG